MALVTGTTLTTSSSGAGGSSFNTASISPTANSLVLVATRSNVGTTPNIPTITGASMTWVEITNTLFSSDNGQISLFRSLSSSPGSGALTIDFAGQSQDQIHWQISEFANVDRSGTNGSGAIVQSTTTTASSVTTITATLSAFSSVNNATYGCIGANNTKVFTAGSGFTELGQNNDNSRSIEAEWKNSNDTSVDWTVGANADNFGAIAIEIKNIQVGGFLGIL